MRKIKQILLSILLLNIPILASANSISESEFNSQINVGNIPSNVFASESSCITTRDDYNIQHPSYKRSNCFSYNGDFYYFICQIDNSCIINSSK